MYDKSDTKGLRSDLNEFEKYCDKIKFKLNSEKSVHLRIYFKDCNLLDTYQLNNTQIQTKPFHKHLGLIIDNRLSNNDWVENMFNNFLKKWHYLLKLFPYAKTEILLKKIQNIYNTNHRVL